MVEVVDVSAGCDDIAIVEEVEEAETPLDVVDGTEVAAVTLVDDTGWEIGAHDVVVTTPPVPITLVVPIVANTVAAVVTTVVVGAAIVAAAAIDATVDVDVESAILRPTNQHLDLLTF